MSENLLEDIKEDIGIIKADVIQVKTVLLGVPGTAEQGLVGKVKTQGLSLEGLKGKVNKLSLRFWVLTAVVTSSGGGSLYGILQLLN